MTTAQHARVTLSVELTPGQATNLGVWDARSGGETTAEVSKHRSGGLGAELVFAGLPSHGDITLSRAYLKTRDHELARTLRKRTGAKVTVSEAILDEDGVVWGSPVVSTGVLTGVNPGDVDSNSGDPRILELTVTVGSVV